jgi:hypothetical protein
VPPDIAAALAARAASRLQALGLAAFQLGKRGRELLAVGRCPRQRLY